MKRVWTGVLTFLCWLQKMAKAGCPGVLWWWQNTRSQSCCRARHCHKTPTETHLRPLSLFQPPATTLALLRGVFTYLHLDGRGAVGEVQGQGGEAEHVLQQLLVHGATALRRLALHIRVRTACRHKEEGSSGLVRRGVGFFFGGGGREGCDVRSARCLARRKYMPALSWWALMGHAWSTPDTCSIQIHGM